MRKVFYFLSLGLLMTCFSEVDSDPNPTDLASLNGQELAEIYCGSCHLYAAPEVLPKDVWKNVLPKMGNYLGIYDKQDSPYASQTMEEELRLKQATIYPEEPLLADTVWQKIIAYYIEHAPDSLTQILSDSWSPNQLFRQKSHTIRTGTAAAVTMVKIDAERNQLLVGELDGKVTFFDATMQAKVSTQLQTPVIDAAYSAQQDRWLLQEVGILQPNNRQTGQTVSFSTTTGRYPTTMATQLPRPVQIETLQLTAEGEEAVLVCGFGHELGALLLLHPTALRYRQEVLKNVPGALKAEIFDADQDGDSDFMVLFGQGDESIFLFINENGQFSEQRVLRFSSVNGSSDFELVDFDSDGDLDIVYANGDNGDYSYCLKPYHGLRIYLNTGDFNFEEHFFFPMHGASKVRVADFDLDGDMDIVAAAFYPDFAKPEHSIVYLEQKDSWVFVPQSFSFTDRGRWMVMDAGDMDGDGDEDIVLGSFLLNESFIPATLQQQWMRSTDQVVILENKTKAVK
jgi:hypothetical protein